MKKLERYFKQFEQLLQRIIQDGEIDEYDDGEVMISIHQHEQDEARIAEIISKKPELKEFYSKLKPILVVKKSIEEGIKVLSEELSIRELSEYLQEHPEFEFEMLQESSFSEYVTTRFRGIAEQIDMRLNSGMQIPYLKRNIDNSKRVPIGYTSYDTQQDNFFLSMNNGKVKPMSVYDAMPLVFNYIYQRRNLAHFRNTNNERAIINEIPLGYIEPIKYRDGNQEISDDMEFLR